MRGIRGRMMLMRLKSAGMHPSRMIRPKSVSRRVVLDCERIREAKIPIKLQNKYTHKRQCTASLGEEH